ncbi:hypothetical protein JCM19274_4526 [Algibacter lectus]|uniref:Uncharacterized protein n=1 Tax=Algibacter lectus TaxID=221126 RepID=A0A090X4M2_9FLAO|nr:hypothetical protein [Algibacter lectus]GAL78027.1 hypothetical protein JCM19274_4526 [Algibacter lectus]
MSTSISLPTPIVSVKWLQEHLNNENLIVLDGTINKVFNASQKQIPGTRLSISKRNLAMYRIRFLALFLRKNSFKEKLEI